MLAQLSQWILIATLSQAPQEADWLKVIPADVDVAIHVRGLDVVRNDAVAMLKAMSPEWGKMAEDGSEAHLAQVREKHGEHALKAPLVGMIRLGDSDAPGGMAYGIVVAADDYKGFLTGLMGGKAPDLKHQDGGYDAFEGPEGQGTWYAARAPGIVAFGPAKSLIASIAKPSGKTLDSVLKETAAGPFLSGDIGLYVNAASLTSRFADQIEQARQAFMGLMDQAAQQQPNNESMMKFVKDFYGGLFDSIKNADVITLNLDVAGKGLALTGILNVKADAPAAKSIASIHTSPASRLGHFPAGAMGYLYMDLEAKTFERLQGMSMKMLSNDKPSPELAKAMAELHGLGRIESLGSFSFAKGMSVVNDIIVTDPKKYIDACEAMILAMKGGKGQFNVYKDVQVERNAQTHQGLTFTKIAATMDLEKLAQVAGKNPGQVEAMKSMFGGEKVTYWYGTDGKRLLQVMGPTWESVKAQIDGYLKGEAGIGASPGFQTVRSQLAEQSSLLVLLDARELVRMMANQLSTTLKNPDLKVPDGLPKDPAYLGASLTPRPPLGFEFRLVIPSSVGTVIDKGLIPMLRGLQPGGVNQ